mmetsp:Transcript_42241/g.30933  ORF Transcript_42241/g.30933 Transcript_42241/m.30933 type:complete len:134 (+) Transcript_42241:76-477(+)
MSNSKGDQNKPRPRVFVPVTLKMVEEAQIRPDDQCEIDGEAVTEIVFVGRVIYNSEEAMRTILEVNDNTSICKVIFYQKGEGQVPLALKNFNYNQFMYAKIYGTIRVFKDEKAVVGTHIKALDKFDEVTNHFL